MRQKNDRIAEKGVYRRVHGTYYAVAQKDHKQFCRSFKTQEEASAWRRGVADGSVDPARCPVNALRPGQSMTRAAPIGISWEPCILKHPWGWDTCIQKNGTEKKSHDEH